MATRMSLWRANDDGSVAEVDEKALATEEQIESAIESDPRLLGIDVLIIGRQTQTPSGPLDLLALDRDARLIVIENKRDRTPREVLAQTIDYAAWVAKLDFGEVDDIYAKYRASRGDEGSDLAAAFEERFEEELDSIGDVPRMIVVAAHLDDSTERMIDFLNDSFDVPVNAVLFQPFEGGLLGRTWLRPDVVGARSAGKRSAARAARYERAQRFWEAWLPIGRKILGDIKLPEDAPGRAWIGRMITSGVPAKVVLAVRSSSASAEIEFGDDNPQVNDSLLNVLKSRRSEIEEACGTELDWRSLASNPQQTKRTRIKAPPVGVGDIAEPHDDDLREFAQSVRRLVDAVKPHLRDAFDEASAPDNGQTIHVDGGGSA